MNGGMRAAPGCLPLLFFFAVLLLFPVFLANAMLEALGRLGLTPGLSLAAYEIYLLAAEGWSALALTAVAVAANTIVCWKAARPIQGLGIALPALLPGLVAAAAALLLLPDMAPPAAFVAGVLGPLLGADLLHMDDLEKLSAGVASIGGAGTVDGIVLSGLVATLLA